MRECAVVIPMSCHVNSLYPDAETSGLKYIGPEFAKHVS